MFQRSQEFTLLTLIAVEKLDVFRIISKVHSRARMKVWRQKEENCLIIDWVIWVDWMGWVDISSAKHHLSYAANGLRDHSCFKRKMLVIRGKAIDIKLRKKRFMPAVSILSVMMWLSKAWMTYKGRQIQMWHINNIRKVHIKDYWKGRYF